MPENKVVYKNNRKYRTPILFNLHKFSSSELIFLFSIKDNKYLSEYHKEFDVTYAHTSRIFKRFEKIGIVSFNKIGRKNFIELNPKYKKIIEETGYKLRKMLEDFKNDKIV